MFEYSYLVNVGIVRVDEGLTLARQVSAKTRTKFDLLGSGGEIGQAAYQKDWAHHVLALRSFPDAGNFPFTE